MVTRRPANSRLSTRFGSLGPLAWTNKPADEGRISPLPVQNTGASLDFGVFVRCSRWQAPGSGLQASGVSLERFDQALQRAKELGTLLVEHADVPTLKKVESGG